MTTKLRQECIGILTDAQYFDDNIESFKRSGINATKIDLDAKLDGYTILFVDLGFSLDMGYVFLDKISDDLRYSAIDIFVILNNKSELQKLSSLQILRINHYVSNQVSSRDLFSLIKLARISKRTLRKTFPKTKMEASAKGFVTHVSESGALISSQILFQKTNKISIKSNLLRMMMGEDEPIYHTSKAVLAPGGGFIAEIDFLNLSLETRERIRKAIIGWDLK